MKRRVELIAAPPGMQPGGYVRTAYADRTLPATPWVDVSVEPRGDGWHLLLAWPCDTPVKSTSGDVDRFADAVAVLAPAADDAPIMTMGSEAARVDGWLWRADRDGAQRFSARGLGTVERHDPDPGASVQGVWANARWGVRLELPAWGSLSQRRRLGVAVWRGADAERAGLKSVSPAWIDVP